MRRFLVEGWGFDTIPAVVWCRGIVCDICQLRFQCFTMSPDEDFLIENREDWLRQMKFQDKKLPIHIEGYRVDKDGSVMTRMGMHIETVIDYLIAGEAGQRVPDDGRWNQGWVYQGGARCPYRKKYLHVLEPCGHQFCYQERECKRGMRGDFSYNGEIIGTMQGGELVKCR